MEILNKTSGAPPSTGDKNKDHILAWAIEQYRWSQQQHEREWSQDAFTFYRHYRNFLNTERDADDNTTNIAVGLAYPFVKLISARLMSPYMAGDQVLDATALDAAGVKRAPWVAAWVNDMLVNRIPRSYSKLELVKEAGLALGRGILKPVVRARPAMSILKRIATMAAQAAIPGGVPVASQLAWSKIPRSRQMDLEYVDPFNWWKVGSSRWVGDCNFTVEQSFHTAMDIWQMIRSGDLDPSLAIDDNGMGYDEYTRRRMDLESGTTDMVHAGTGAPKPHRIVEIQGWIETKKTRNGHPVYEQGIVKFLNEGTFGSSERLSTWDGKPGYIVFEPWQDFGTPRPIGMIEPIEQLLYLYNDMTNLAVDNARKIVETTLIADKTQTKQDRIYIGAGEVNWFRNPSQSVKALEMRDLPRGFFMMYGGVSDLMQRIVGISDYFGGVATADTGKLTKTARGIEAMVNQAADRFQPVLTKMDREFYREIAHWIHETGKQRMDKPESLALPGNPTSPFVKLGPSDLDIPLGFAFNVKAMDQASGKRRQDFLEAMQIIMNPQVAQGLMMQGAQIDMYEFARMVMGQFDLEREADVVIKKMQMPMLPGMGGPFATQNQPSMPGAPMPPGGTMPGAAPPIAA